MTPVIAPSRGIPGDFDRAGGLPGDRLPLRRGSVLIFESLDHEDRASNARKIFFNIPAAEIGMEPDVIPSPECAGGVAMMAAKFPGKIRRLETCFSLGDAGHAQVLDKDVWSEQHETADAVVGSGMDKRD